MMVCMDARAFLREITGDVRYRGQIAHVREIPAREASYAEPAAGLDERLASLLRRQNIHRLYTHQAAAIDAVAAVEARGFLFAGPLAMRLGVGIIPVRKPGKLPAETISHQYDLEYGSDTLEMHSGILTPESRVLIVDDVLATGGTAAACAQLIAASGATVAGCSFLVELDGLGGRERLTAHRIESVLHY